MYRQAYQRGMLTIFYSVGSKPLEIWDTVIRDGYITRFLDDDIKSMVLEIGGTNVSTTYMICPKGNAVLGINMPFLVMIVKNLKKYFSFEVTILDETRTRRRFRASNFQSTTQILPLCTAMPIGLSEGWNQIQFNLSEFTRRAYKKQYIEVQKLKINANIRLRRIYFAERIIPEDQLPAEYKLFFPLKQRSAGVKDQKTGTETKEEFIDLPEKAKLTELKEDIKSRSFSKDKSSMQVIKRPSQQQHFEARSSHILKVAEDNLDRINAVTEVPVVIDKVSQIEVLAAGAKTSESIKEKFANTSQNDILAVEAETIESMKENSANASQKDIVGADAETIEPIKEKSANASLEDILEVEPETTEAIKEKSSNTEIVMESQITVEGPETEDDLTGGYEEDEGDASAEPVTENEE